MTTGTNNFVSLIVQITLLELASVLSAPDADQKAWFVNLRFNATLELINYISSDLQKILR